MTGQDGRHTHVSTPMIDCGVLAVRPAAAHSKPHSCSWHSVGSPSPKYRYRVIRSGHYNVQTEYNRSGYHNVQKQYISLAIIMYRKNMQVWLS